MASEVTVAQPAAVSPSTSTSRMPRRGLLVALLAALIAAGSLAAAPAPSLASAARIKVAIIVGPSGANTSMYLRAAHGYAAQARSYGANVVEVDTPHATWPRVKAAVQGAKLVIYLGHGNGFPNPYLSRFDPKKVDGFGLNPYDGSGNTRTLYYGEAFLRSSVRLAPNAVVIVNHACYSAGSSEPGRANPTLAAARQRADNFAAGFLHIGARAVFAETLASASYIIGGLFRSNLSMSGIFWSDPTAKVAYKQTFASARTAGATLVMDPYRPGAYYRAVTGFLGMTAATWRH